MSKKPISFFIIGTGNVASFFTHTFTKGGLAPKGIFGRNKIAGTQISDRYNIPYFSDINNIPTDADIYIVAIKDAFISEISNLIPEVSGVVAHTSGTTSLEALKNHKRRGVFYPMQTLSTSVPFPEKNEFPILIEATNEIDLRFLYNLAFEFTSQVEFVNSYTREKYHLAAVMAANFTNQLLRVSKQLLAESELEFSLLKPLMLQQIKNSFTIGPEKAQTGPAKRNDSSVLQRHENLLSEHPEWQKLYRLLSDLIQLEEKK